MSEKDNGSGYIVAMKISLDRRGYIKATPIYYDQLYKLPFWLNVKLKLKRWMR